MKKNQLVKVSDETPNVLKKLDKRIAGLKKERETSYKTSGNIGDGFGNIRNETLIPNLIRMASVVLAKETNYHAGAKWLGLKKYPDFEIGGNTAEEFRSDIILRYKNLEHDNTFNTLTSFREKASKFLSEEEQKSMLFKEMAAFLGEPLNDDEEAQVADVIEE